MSAPAQAVTTDDGRYYTWPRWPKRHLPSITTVIKQGVPKPTMQAWERKTIADKAIESAEKVVALKRKAADYEAEKQAKKAAK